MTPGKMLEQFAAIPPEREYKYPEIVTLHDGRTVQVLSTITRGLKWYIVTTTGDYPYSSIKSTNGIET